MLFLAVSGSSQLPVVNRVVSFGCAGMELSIAGVTESLGSYREKTIARKASGVAE